MSEVPAFPYGAVYFRKSNPPAEDWARDYRIAAEDGVNTFRHWFLWSAIEVAPGVYDWADYDRQLDLAVENGIATVIAEFVTAAPEWAWRQLSHARFEDREGRKARSQYSHSCAVGGFPGLCLDNPDARELAERFLRALVERYRSHPGLAAYDIWNECNIPAAYCYCPATAERFREWLQAKYGDVSALGRAWRRYGIAAWEDAEPPRTLAPYPDVLDWLQFRIDNAYRLMRWRADLIRSLDPEHPVTAHGVTHSLASMADGACHEWRAAAEVASYGFTWVASRRGNEPWKQWHAVDITRAGSRGEIGIVVVPESQLFCYAQHGSTDLYAQSARGSYQGFFENGIQADWVLIDHIDEYETLYLPFPAMLPSTVAERLRIWVERGGTLISEGCPGYFGDRGHVGAVQPANGLDTLFGAREAYVEFTPDLLGDLTFEIGDLTVPGGIFLQAYEPTTGTAAGRYIGSAAGQYGEGQIAVVDHTFGRGRTRLIGTFPGYGHVHRPSADSRAFFAALATWAGIDPHVRVSGRTASSATTVTSSTNGAASASGHAPTLDVASLPGVVARLHASPTSTFLWLLNHNRQPVSLTVEIGERRGPFQPAVTRWGDGPVKIEGRRLTVQLAGRDGAILELR